MTHTAELERRLSEATIPTARLEEIRDGEPNRKGNTGHGHVWPRPDGMKARCGGPGLCLECSRDEALKTRSAKAQSEIQTMASELIERRNKDAEHD